MHPLGEDGSVGGEPTSVVNTAVGAHAMQTDRSNRFAYVPHIARQNDNVLEPPKNIPAPNVIYQFRFDESTGALTHNDPPVLTQDDFIGPRHFTFHPTLGRGVFLQRAGLQRVSLPDG